MGQIGNCRQVFVAIIGVHLTMHLIDPIKVVATYTVIDHEGVHVCGC